MESATHVFAQKKFSSFETQIRRARDYSHNYSLNCSPHGPITKQLLDEVEHDIMNYQNRGLCYLPKPKAEANITDTRF